MTKEMNDLISRINKAKEIDDNEKMIKEKDQRFKEEKLTEKVQSLEPRIKELINVANAMIDAGYYFEIIDGFRSEGWVHKIGFMYNKSTNHIDSMGKVNGGFCGDYDFHTNGKDLYMTCNYGYTPVDRPVKWMNVEEFIERFDDFETRFKTAIEKFLKSKNV